MSIYIGPSSPRHTVVTTHHDFVSVNPWFEMAITDRLYREFESDKLKYKIRNQLQDQFPALFRQQMLDTETWGILSKKIDSRVDDGISRVNQAVANKVSDLVENKDELSSIKTAVISETTRKYDNFQADLSRRSEEQERLRNEKIKSLEKQVEGIRSSQTYTFLGGSILGGVVGILASKWI
jgi:hypothetical protein